MRSPRILAMAAILFSSRAGIGGLGSDRSILPSATTPTRNMEIFGGRVQSLALMIVSAMTAS